MISISSPANGVLQKMGSDTGTVTAILQGLPKKWFLPATKEWSALLGIGRLDKSQKKIEYEFIKDVAGFFMPVRNRRVNSNNLQGGQ